MSKSYGFMQRVIAFAGALIITFNVVAAPQRARAVAVTASVVASVAAIMTACGVTYWAASQTDAIDYLGGRIDAYLGSLETVPQSYEDWLGIDAASQLFEVTANGAMRFGSGVANKILAFVRSFNQSEGVVSGGTPVVDARYTQTVESVGVPPAGSVGASFFDSSTISLVYSECKDVNGGADYGCAVGLPAESVRVYVAYAEYGRYAFDTARRFYVSVGGNPDGQLSMSQGSYVDISGNIGDQVLFLADLGQHISNGHFRLEFRGASFVEDKARVTPSDAVSVPEDLAEDSAYDVAPSVPLTQGMTVDQASDAVLSGVASEDGLTAEGDAAEGAVAGWGWLADLLERIREAVQGTQEQTAPAQYEAIDDYQLDLTQFFPFCIPWDLHRGLSLLVAEPVAPSINWTVPLPGGGTYTLALDLSEWDGVAQVARTMELLAFVVALAVATKKLIKW